jgi:hypothetical protein
VVVVLSVAQTLEAGEEAERLGVVEPSSSHHEIPSPVAHGHPPPCAPTWPGAGG